MIQKIHRLRSSTLHLVDEIFNKLDYTTLGRVYCNEGGEAFWRARRRSCQKNGISIAGVLRGRLRRGGRSLYVGAGVAEISILTMEAVELNRKVAAYNLRGREVKQLNRACRDLPFQFLCRDASLVKGTFDHLWMVSVLNDPERFPELSALSYGRANPVTFHPHTFIREHRMVSRLTGACLKKLNIPGLVTTSVEEIPWITDWCKRKGIPCVVEEEEYPTAIVGDPLCFIRVG